MTARQLFSRYQPSRDDPATTLRQLVADSHMVIKLTAASSEEEPHSTVAAFLMNPGGDCAWIHAGDSRIYHFRDGRLVTRTRDHSYVQALVDRGEITEDEAHTHPQGNILVGCLGMAKTPPPIETHHIAELRPGDLLMACSDGLWPYFTPQELGVVLSEQSPRSAAELLVSEVRLRCMASGDNISIVILKVETLPEETTDQP